MQVLALDLKDVKSYAAAHVEFTPGMNAIVGHNGAGKSTILEAIGFALFDSLAYTHKDFVRGGAKSAEVTVTLLSSMDARPYQVVRRCGSSNAYFVHDPELESRLCEGKSDVLAFLHQHLGVDPGAELDRLFSDAVGVPQGTFTAAFLGRPAQRKGIFDPLLQVEEYRQAYDRLREPITLLKARQQELDVEMAGLTARLERLPLLQQEVETRTQTLEAVATQQEQVSVQLTTLNEQLAGLEKVQATVTALERRNSEAQSNLRTARLRLETAEQAVAEATDAAAQVAENQAGHRAYLAAREQQQALEQQARARSTLEEERSNADKARALALAEQERLVVSLREISDAEGLLAGLAADITKQEELEREISQAQQASSRLADAEQELARLKNEQESQVARLRTLEAGIKRAEELDRQRQQLEASATAAEQEQRRLRDQLAAIEVEAKAAQEQTAQLEAVATARCPVCEQPLTADHRAEMLSRNEATVQTLRSQYRTAQSAAQEQESKLGELQKSLRSVSAELRSAPRQSESDAVTESLRKLDGSLQEAKNRVETLHDAPQKLAQLKAALSKLGNPQQQAATARAAIARKQNLEAAFERSKSAVTAAERSLGELEGKLAEFAELDSTLDAASHALNTHAAAYQAVLASQQLAQTLAARRQSAAQERNALEQAQKSDEEIGQALAEARRDFDPEAYATLNADAQRLRAEAASLSTQSRMLTEAQTADQRAIAQLEEQALLLTADVERKANLVEQEALLEQLRSVIRQAGPYITSTLISRISEGANQMFGDIMQDYSRYLAWNEDYSITLDVEGTERQFSQLSGGEQMAGALSVRLALLREMSNIDIAFFDEPTTNLDSTRRESLAQQIRNLQGLQQIFVISHDDTFEQDTHNVIRVARVDGASTVVEEW